MEMNSLIFRPPLPSYTYSRFGDELLWIPKEKNKFIPSLFLQSNHGSTKTILFFHANAEDLGKVYDFLDIIRCVLEVSIFAPEYPGYGLYKGKARCKNILEDSLVVLNFVQNCLGVQKEDIIIIGRSIGTGPACSLASQGCGGLVLLSPYTSLRQLIKKLAGSFLQYFVKDQFKNIDWLKQVECPVLLIHGKKDGLIPFEHSQQLANVCKGPVSIYLSETMTHNKFEYYEDVISPIDKFFKDNCILLEQRAIVKVPEECLKPPRFICVQNEILTDFL
jgi:fermentation-respiration switch protein FrsA (DUF1100 family)